jgi:rod shape-determining protein MreC
MGGVLPPAERRSSALLGLYATLSILLLLVGDRIPASALRATGAWLFAPFDKAVLTVDRLAAAWRENQALHERLTRLELENLRLREAGVENARLRHLLDLPPWRDVRLKPAEVLALSGEAMPTAATLSAGRNQGVKDGDVAVTEDGLLGRVGEVYPAMSRVVLLTDPNSAVACEVESTGVLGILRFTSVPQPQLVLTGVPLSDTLRVGQKVLTSGMSRRYPRGIAVGTVMRLSRDAGGLTQEVEVAPAAKLSRVRHVFLLTPPPLPEIPRQ